LTWQWSAARIALRCCPAASAWRMIALLPVTEIWLLDIQFHVRSKPF
jgi:hypothetical protein